MFGDVIFKLGFDLDPNLSFIFSLFIIVPLSLFRNIRFFVKYSAIGCGLIILVLLFVLEFNLEFLYLNYSELPRSVVFGILKYIFMKKIN